MRGSTRGDGEVGEDVSENLRTIRADAAPAGGIGVTLSRGTLSVRGEALMLAVRVRGAQQAADRGAARSRSPPRATRAAGTVRQLDPSITASRKLDFYAYDLLAAERRREPDTQIEVLESLRGLGIPRRPHRRRAATGIEAAFEFHAALLERRERLDFEIDGAVIKVDRARLAGAARRALAQPALGGGVQVPAARGESR